MLFNSFVLIGQTDYVVSTNSSCQYNVGGASYYILSTLTLKSKVLLNNIPTVGCEDLVDVNLSLCRIGDSNDPNFIPSASTVSVEIRSGYTKGSLGVATTSDYSIENIGDFVLSQESDFWGPVNVFKANNIPLPGNLDICANPLNLHFVIKLIKNRSGFLTPDEVSVLLPGLFKVKITENCASPITFNNGFFEYFASGVIPDNGITQLSSLIPIANRIVNPSGSLQRVVLNGNLNIDEDFTFSGFLYLNNNSKIIVPAGRTLQLNDLILKSCKNRMWDQIEVQEGGTLKSNYADIEDGFYAINSTNGNVKLENVEFKRNYISYQGIGSKCKTEKILNTVFDGLEDMKDIPSKYIFNRGKQPFAGINLKDVIDFNIYPGISNYNMKFKNLINGIVAQNSIVKLSKSYFTNITPRRLPGNFIVLNGGHGILASGVNGKIETYPEKENRLEFNRCDQGITINDGRLYSKFTYFNYVNRGIQLLGNTNLGFGRAQVIENTMNEVQNKGIFINKYLTLYSSFTNNKINMNSQSVQNDDDIVRNVGIEMQNDQIYDNFFNFNNNDVNIKNKTERGFLLNGGYGNYLTSNVVYKSDNITPFKGIELTNQKYLIASCNNSGQRTLSTSRSSSAYLMSDILGSNINCNSANNTLNGFEFKGTSMLGANFGGNEPGTHVAGLYYNEGVSMTTQTHKGNNLGGYVPYRPYAYHQSLDPNIKALYVVNSNTNYDCKTSPEQWFRKEVNQKTWTCALNNTCPNGIRQVPPSFECTYSDLELRLAKDEVYNSGEIEQKYNADEQLYTLVNDMPCDVPNRDVLDNFVNSLGNSNIAKFYAIEKGMVSLNTPTSALNNKYTIFDSKGEELNTLNNQINIDNNSVALATQKSIVVNELGALSVEIQNLQQELSNRMKSNALMLKNKNGQIVAANIQESNRKKVNDCILNNIISDSYFIATTDTIVLKSIANQCPKYGGKSVYSARAILSRYFDNEYRDDCALNNAQLRRKNDQTQLTETGLTIAPNPANSNLLLKWDTKVADASITLLDITGKMIQQYHTDDVNVFDIDLTNFENGMYLLHIESRNNESITRKVIVQK